MNGPEAASGAGDPLSPDSTHGDPADPTTSYLHVGAGVGTGNLTASAQDRRDLQQLLALARNPPPGASVYSPEAVVSSVQNPRSCVTCRRRKVRCDKLMPCSNCRRVKIPCIFPAPGRAPRRPRAKDPNAPSKPASGGVSGGREQELLERLRKLEGIVEDLSGQIEVEGVRHSSASGSPEALVGHEGEAGHGTSARGAPLQEGHHGSDFAPQDKTVVPQPNRTRSMPIDMQKHFGRLVLNDEGQTRYVSSGFWSKINDELDYIRQETHKVSDDESEESDDDDNTPESLASQARASIDHQSFIMGYRSSDVDLRPLHPLPSQIPFMWQIFLENVDPVVKVLHVPTMNKTIREARDNLDSLTASTEALLFSIYYAAITSLNEEDVVKNFGAEKDFLISQYRFAVEQALAKANYIVAPDVTVIQAFVLFLILVRRHDDARFCWTLTGLLTRVSNGIGLHRDGANFPNLTPFETEMRRRLFWQICLLDLRSAEDQGTDLTVIDRTFDVRLPLNINDADFGPDSTELPTARVGQTDMTISLVRTELCILARRLHSATSANAQVCPFEASRTLEEREAMIEETYNRVEHSYLKDENIGSDPMMWVAANVARVIIAKTMLMIYQPYLLPGPSSEQLAIATRERLFRTAIEVFEYNHLLNTDPRASRWRWLFQSYTQWHAVAYILLEAARRPWNATVERAWAALNSVFASPKPLELQKMTDHTAIWLPFRKLFLKARKHRDAEIARLRADPQAARQLDLDERMKTVPADTIVKLPGAVKSAVAHARWRKLVNAPELPPGAVEAATGRDSPFRTVAMPEMADLAKAAPSTVSTDQIMNFVGSTMSNPHVIPIDFWPGVWSVTDALSEADRLALYNFPESGPMATASSAAPTMPSTTAARNETATPPTLDTSFSLAMDDNPPPWLWSSETGQGQDQTSAGEVGRAEELDVNMDDGFNWQGFQEDLSRFQVANRNFGSAPWSHGF